MMYLLMISVETVVKSSYLEILNSSQKIELRTK
jgi:hypothetical protein